MNVRACWLGVLVVCGMSFATGVLADDKGVSEDIAKNTSDTVATLKETNEKLDQLKAEVAKLKLLTSPVVILTMTNQAIDCGKALGGAVVCTTPEESCKELGYRKVVKLPNASQVACSN